MTTKINITIIILLAVIAVGLLTGCGGDSVGFDDEPQNVAEGATPQEIFIKTDITSMQTRATIIDDATDLQDQDLKIDAYFHDTETKCLDGVKLHYDTDAWKFWDGSTQLHYYWPIEGSVYAQEETNITVSSLDFVGYCPYTTPAYITTEPTYNHSTGISFTCDMSSYMTSTAQDEVTEFMCAIIDDQTITTQTEAGGALPLQFKHPFACIRFQLAASHPDITINSITFKGLKTGGTCTFNGTASTWSSLTPADKTVDFVATINHECHENPASAVSLGDSYLVVPQTFDGNITVNASWTDWGEQFAHNVSTKISPVDWQPGYSYTYTFTITETDLKVDIEKYTEQW